MQRRILLVIIVLLGCGNHREEPVARQPGVTLAVLGQALIRHDPGTYLESPLRSVIPILHDADVVFTNLEVAIPGDSCACEPTRTGLYSHGAGVEVLDYLADLGVSLMSLANNHAWDYGAEGVLSTIAEVEARGFTYAGTGANISVATAPAYLMAGELSVALIAAASVRWPDVVRATENRAGVNILKPGDDADRERNLAGIRLAKETADIVIAYHHFQTGAVEGWQEAWARAAIDAGANIYVSHGEPRLAGVEVYQGGLILYGLGNFIFHTRTEPGHYPTDVWESVIAEVVLDELGVAEVSFVPIVLNPGTEGPLFLETRGYPEVADGETGAAILKRLLDLSARYGTMIELDAGKATLRLGQPK